jgi:regulator of sirC expression with transglutaminase-like and TPR domain
MHNRSLEAEFRRFGADPDSPVEGALLVARVLHPDTDPDWCRGELARLAGAVAAPASPARLVETLRRLGFTGAEQYYDSDNSSLERVLKTRRGIPITLAVVVMGVAEQLGLDAVGINFPRHFLVSVESLLVDPFSMRLTDAATCEAWLEQQQLPPADAFRPATAVDVVLRMLNNLRGLASARGDHAGALELTDYQLAVARDPLPVHVERAELWKAVGAIDMARHDLAQAISLARDATLRQELEERLRALAGTRVTLH